MSVSFFWDGLTFLEKIIQSVGLMLFCIHFGGYANGERADSKSVAGRPVEGSNPLSSAWAI